MECSALENVALQVSQLRLSFSSRVSQVENDAGLVIEATRQIKESTKLAKVQSTRSLLLAILALLEGARIRASARESSEQRHCSWLSL